MTVLWEGPNEPPRKRVCLSTSSNRRRPVPLSAPSQQLSLANASEQCQQSPLNSGVMMNGYGLSDTLHGHGHGHGLKSCTATSPDDGGGGGSGGGGACADSSPIATLCNLGNTCFLNSVLYTLRFAPSFLHNLHHLAEDLKHYSGRHSQFKTKSSSLGRGMGSTSKMWNSSKDLPSLGDSANAKIQLATERLHDLYESLHNTELKDHMEAFQPEVFLHALRDVNPIFEGNQQHDAHELLVCLLDNIRETCRQLSELVEGSLANGGAKGGADLPPLPLLPPPPPPKPTTLIWSSFRKSVKSNKQRQTKLNTYSKDKKTNNEMNNLLNGGTAESIDSNGVGGAAADGSGAEDRPDGGGKSASTAPGHNFIAEDFEGVTLLRTTCVECEMVTERKETFCDICVPIASTNTSLTNNNQGALSEQKINELYREAVVTEEYLHETNKYWCETCLRYNEAKRSVRYESLPRLLTLQLKRFSSSFGSVSSVISKVIDFMPTPLNLSCFCEECSHQPDNQRKHRYQLFGVIMHLGATMASGHYVAYVRGGRECGGEYEHCTRGKRKTASLSGANSKHSSNSSEKAGGLMRLLKIKSNSGSAATNGNSAAGNQQSFYQSCRSADCCGLRMRGADGNDTTRHDCDTSSWLECDDDSVRSVSRAQMEEILTGNKSSKNSALTPYLLFYVRSNQ
ncbi:ubiquitin carboxyl-terminal hydrolase 1 [Nilaparvata lugens]|uniref:ubiquitin carboxyl-terminal hydrolase 1 n=1 Tax=Nilaparvata lugens TaxID=108931 RepID=UPI00193CC863|nr:ubiquitin carboxyl-terminal hydrolase 1 [Nilaparvata lugens]